MSLEDNKRIVIDGFFGNLNAGRVDAMIDLLSESFSWWTAGHWPLAGTKSRDEFVHMLTNIKSLSNWENLEEEKVIGITAEGERVAVETELAAKMKGGQIYRNQRHYLFVVRDGKIHRAKQYLDTMRAAEMLCG